MLDDPDQMTVQQRQDEIASILATGILRLRARRRPASDRIRQQNKDAQIGEHGTFTLQQLRSMSVKQVGVKCLGGFYCS